MTQLVRKISRATVYGPSVNLLETVLKDKTKPVPLYRVFGWCNGSRSGETDYGKWTAMLGQFQAINSETGEVFVSGVAFLPAFAADVVLGQLGGDTEKVAFAFDIAAEYDSSSDRPNYRYTATPLMDPAENDPLALLAKSLPEPDKRLAGPKKKE